MPFRFEKGVLPGLLFIEPRVFDDPRGFFLELYKRTDFAREGVPEFVQDNLSFSRARTLRGLHFQRPPHAQGKLVQALSGESYDVAVDLRPSSPAFGQWQATTLSRDNRRMVYIPEGCAHGFCVLSDTAEVSYKTTAEYDPASESGIAWNDEALAIDWPVPAPLLSARDEDWPRLAAADTGFD